MLRVTLPRAIMLSVIMLNVLILSVFLLSALMLSVIMLNVVMLSDLMLSFMLSVILLSVVSLNVVMPSYVVLIVIMQNGITTTVVAPTRRQRQWFSLNKQRLFNFGLQPAYQRPPLMKQIERKKSKWTSLTNYHVRCRTNELD